MAVSWLVMSALDIMIRRDDLLLDSWYGMYALCEYTGSCWCVWNFGPMGFEMSTMCALLL